MANQKYTLTFDAKMEIGQAKQSLQQFQNILNGLQLPQNFSRNIQKNIDDLTKSIQNFEVQSSKKISSKTDITALERNAKKISDLFETIKLQFRDLGNLSGKDLDRLFPGSVVENIRKATQAMANYNSVIESSNRAIKKQENSLRTAAAKEAAALKNLTKAQEELKSSRASGSNIDNQIVGKTGIKDIEEAKKKLDELVKAQEEYYARIQSGKTEKGKKYEYAQSTKDKALNELNALKQLQQAYQQQDSIIQQNQEAVRKAAAEYEKASNNVIKFEQTIEQLKQQAGTEQKQALETLFQELQKISGIDLTGVEHTFENAEKAIAGLSQTARDKLSVTLQQALNNTKNLDSGIGNLDKKFDELNTDMEEFDTRAKDIESIKTRITYFFGLNNAIQLVRRTIRSAFNTIKELDKAMTETAVVTNFTVSDMWSQLPEYTKRAKELGVTTLEAYQAATLYYQQGLKTNGVMAISNETLKMARIAGLDAAEATDRMTNALRGFNMELNETSAQRVDDVYSKLAAITASNVDEISTAMTKVASLANNANMKFENTAAFLAQIIETTRESAETAGTALKTVIARFSEVKNLYSENELMGTDEEGQEIDVNRISTALRTAGIDLNKYFLGEVGLDEIFMELAKKWNSLTKVQQRYIATQAAGSRQQSRFIALMSDYARTQELTTAAFNAEGAAASQFEKTQDSLQSKLAKLKDAWDEFAMGITNSSLVKAGVTLLTKILELVNKLTDAFGLLKGNVGGFISSLLRISLVASLLKVGSIFTKGIWAKAAGTNVKEAWFKAAFGKAGFDRVGAEGVKNYSTAKIFGQGFINPFGFGNKTRTGAKAAQAAKAASSSTALVPVSGTTTAQAGVSSAAAGAGSIAIAFIAITAAAVAAGIAIKKVYDASPTGQLKIAGRLEKSIGNISAKITEANTSFKTGLDNYTKWLEAIEEATYGTTEWANALEGVNSNVKQLIEAYPDLIRYVSVSSSGVMTVSKEGLKIAQRELEQTQKQANFLTLLAKGNTAQKSAILNREGGFFGGNRDLSQANIQSARSVAYYRTAFKEYFGDKINDSAINAISETLDFNKLVRYANEENYNWFQRSIRGKDFWQNEYLKATGTTADESWTVKQIQEQLGSLDALDRIEEILTELNGKIKEEDYKEIADIIGKNTEIDTSEAYNEYIEAISKGIEGLPSDQSSEEILQLLGTQFTTEGLQMLEDTGGVYDAAYQAIKQKFYNRYKLIDEYDEVDSEKMAALLKANGVYSEEELFYKYISSLVEIRDDFLKNTKNAAEIFGKNFNSTGYKTLFNSLTNGSFEESGLTAQQYSKLSEVLTSFGLQGASAEELGIFEKLKPTDTEKAKQYLQILSQMGPTDASSILSVFTQFEKLGIDFSELGNSALEAANSIIKMAHASSTVDFEKLKEKVKDTSNFIKDINERDSNNKTFTQEEFDKFIKGTALEDSFIYTGIEGQEYVYSGQLDEIVRILQEQLNLEVDNSRTTLDRQVEIGEQLQNDSYLKDIVQNVVNRETAFYGVDYKEQWLKEINDYFSKYGYNLSDLNEENLINQLSEFLTYSENLDTLQKQQKNFDEYTLIPQYTQKSLSEIQTSAEAQPYYDKILEAKLQTDETALSVYDAIEKKLRETIKDDTERLKLAKELAIVYSEQSKKIDRLNEKIKENSDGLKTNNKAAIRNVAKELSSIYGIDISDEFVQNNKEALLQMEEDQESYYKVLSALNKQWLLEHNTGYQNLSELSKNWLDNLIQQIESVPDVDVAATIDPTAWDQTIMGMFSSVEDLENYLSTLGWALDWDLYGKDATLEQILGGQLKLVRIKGSGTGFYSGSSGGGGGGNSSWKNEQDRLYNLLQDIAEEQRKQTKLQEDYNRITTDPNATSQDLIKNITDQLASYQKLYGYQAARYVERQRDMEEYQKENSEYGQYVWYNKDDKTVEQNWTLINSLKETDKEKYDAIVEIKNHLESLESDMDEADDSMREIESQVRELQNVLRDSYIDFEKRVRDALIASQQEVIDNYSELNDTLNQTASDILQSLQNEIALQRQIRDNTKTEEDISQKEIRLAYLRRDTTKKNQQEILKLEKELDESRQNYEDTLVDQAINRLSQQNDKSAEQREHQIEIMQAQLDYSEKNGEFNEEVKQIIQEGIDQNGHPVQESRLMELLKSADGWKALSEEERKVWNEELATQTVQVGAYLSHEIEPILENTQKSFDEIKSIILNDIPDKLDAIVNAINQKSFDIPDYQPSVTYNNTYVGSNGGYTPETNEVPEGWNKNTGINGIKYRIQADPLKNITTDEQNRVATIFSKYNLDRDFSSKNEAQNALDKAKELAKLEGKLGIYNSIFEKLRPFAVAYASGGLNTKTGPAWLDGTLSRPEYVLNADQTQAFLKLANVLPQLLSSSSSITNTKVAGDIYLDLTMNVDEIGSDYDVDKIADRVKEIVYDSSTYRNVNVINFTR